MARLRAVLLALTASWIPLASCGADSVSLVQSAAQRVAEGDTDPGDESVLGVLSGLVDMMKVDTFLRNQFAAATGANHAAESAKLESIREPLAPPVHLPARGLADVISEDVSLEGTGCNVEDHLRMNNSLKNLGMAMMGGPEMVKQSIPKECDKVALGVDYGTYSACVAKLLDVSPRCSTCHYDLMRGLLGRNFFHLGCVPRCLPMTAVCQDGPEAGKRRKKKAATSKDCLAATGTCLQCSLPSWRDHMRCVGGIRNREQGIQLLESIAVALKDGSILKPGKLVTLLRSVAELTK